MAAHGMTPRSPIAVSFSVSIVGTLPPTARLRHGDPLLDPGTLRAVRDLSLGRGYFTGISTFSSVSVSFA